MACTAGRSSDIQLNGFNLGFEISGHTIYAASVVLTNGVLIQEFTNLRYKGYLLNFFSVALIFLIMFLEDQQDIVEEVGHFFGSAFLTYNLYFSIFLSVGSGCLFMNAYRHVPLIKDLGKEPHKLSWTDYLTKKLDTQIKDEVPEDTKEEEIV